jgi:Outer membrane protein beta-barrel domain
VKKIIVCLIFASELAAIPVPSLIADWGIKGGVGISGLHSATGDFRHYLGYEMDWLRMGNLLSDQIGVSRSFSLSDKFQIQPELSYSVRGGDAGEEYLFESVIYQIKMTYLEIPLLFKCRIPVI